MCPRERRGKKTKIGCEKNIYSEWCTPYVYLNCFVLGMVIVSVVRMIGSRNTMEFEVTNPMFIFHVFSSISHKQSEVTNPMFILCVFASISRRQSEVTNPMFIFRVFS